MQDKLDGHSIIALLKASAKLKDLKRAAMIHSEIERRGLLEQNAFVGSALVDMYAKCGSLAKAKQVFDRLQTRDTVSWNALITGHANSGRCEEALGLYEQMQLEGVFPNAVTFLCSLKACCTVGAIEEGLELHGEITKLDFIGSSLMVNSALVDMYAKCGFLAEASFVLKKLPVRDVVSWTALIAGYADYGHCEKALKYFEQMQSEGVYPDAFTYVCSLRACSSMRAASKGQEIHADIKNKGLERNNFVGSALVDFYAKCGFPLEAQEIFDNLPARDTVLWNALIAGYVDCGLHKEALRCLDKMQGEGFVLDTPLCVCCLKACSSLGAIDKGQEIHAEIERQEISQSGMAAGSALVDMYAKCGFLSKAQEVFDRLPVRDIFSWNALIGGYAEHEHGEEAFEHFEQMQSEAVCLDSATYACILKACGWRGAIGKGIELHAEVARKGLFERDMVLGNSLVGMYAECGSFKKAHEVFDKLPARDCVSWNMLIAGYAEYEYVGEALKAFRAMQSEGIPPDAFILVSLLKVCSSAGATGGGQEVHAHIERLHLLEGNPLVGSALVNMYAKCGLLAKAQQVFDELRFQEVACWNTLMIGYAEHGYGEEALKIYQKLQLKAIPLDATTYVCILKVCGLVKAADMGHKIHVEVARKGLLQKDLAIGNTLVDMYAKCCLFGKARKVFDNLPVRDVISWTAMISGYSDSGDGEEALICLDKMQSEGVFPNAVTLVCALKACGSIGAIDRGQELHAEIERKGLLESDPNVSSTLVDMYARCGSLHIAQQVFDRLPARGVMSWNALIAGYVQIGQSENVFSIYDRMLRENLNPDPVTFLIVLNACSRTGLLSKSRTFFETMSNEHGLDPMLEHCSCVVDLLVRAGQLCEAAAVIKKVPLSSNFEMWHTVLGACRSWGNVEVGVEAFKNATSFD
ncbi:hypothetical protein GOP47_0016157 [Adiantum capillus-veneris]|uniref:Pentatricopeptide repeat-containing protein n=1 Tax=Adiantum capillus-veneris TaxID=13818 RepID=A0A9D4ULW4_ADICA|nr:hypothetical protein GOP47_0016157 [Adiantum capillus-veneris]